MKEHKDHHAKGIILIMSGLFTFVTTNVTLRFLEQSYPTVEILWFRYFVGLIPALILLHSVYGWESLKTHHIFSHAIRGGFGALSIGCLFQSILLLPFADANVISFCSSLFLVALAAFVLKEHISLGQGMCILLGFLGVFVMAKPTGDGALLGIGLGLTSAFIEAAIMIHNRLFAKKEGGGAILFYQTFFSMVACSLFLPLGWVTPTQHDLGIMVFLGLGGGLGQYLVIKAYRFAPARLLAPMIYSPMIWSVLYGYLFFHENPSSDLFLGSFLIITSGMLVIWLEMRYTKIKQLTKHTKM